MFHAVGLSPSVPAVLQHADGNQTPKGALEGVARWGRGLPIPWGSETRARTLTHNAPRGWGQVSG